MPSELENARNNNICAALFFHYDILFICNKNDYFSTGPLLCSAQRTGSAQQVRCLFNISFYCNLKAHSSVFYLEHVADSAQGTKRHISSLLLSQSPLQYIVLNFSFCLVFPATPIIGVSSRIFPLNLHFFWVKRKQHQRLGTNSFLKEA